MNTFTSMLSLKYPIIQGPFGGGLSSAELVKSVADFGGLGSFGAHHLSPEKITQLIKELKSSTQGAFAINLWVANDDYFTGTMSKTQYAKCLDLFKPAYDQLGLSPPIYKETFTDDYEVQLQATIDETPPAISFVFGVPREEVVAECKSRKIVTIGTATTLQEALELEAVGIDLIVASGMEAGGHRVSFLDEPENCLIGSMSLIPQIVDQVKVPVIAAGGIADVRGVRAAMALGAQGVQIGTAFLACQESGATVIHKRTLLSQHVYDTVLSRAYTGRLARFINNEFIRYVEQTNSLPLPYPLQNYFVSKIKGEASVKNNFDYASLYAGQSTPLLQHSKAYDLMHSLVVDFV